MAAPKIPIPSREAASEIAILAATYQADRQEDQYWFGTAVALVAASLAFMGLTVPYVFRSETRPPFVLTLFLPAIPVGVLCFLAMGFFASGVRRLELERIELRFQELLRNSDINMAVPSHTLVSRYIWEWKYTGRRQRFLNGFSWSMALVAVAAYSGALIVDTVTQGGAFVVICGAAAGLLYGGAIVTAAAVLLIDVPARERLITQAELSFNRRARVERPPTPSSRPRSQ
jgi:hypothetical protein